METTYWDLRTGGTVTTSGRAKTVYEIISKSEKKICVRNLTNSIEHCMDTNQFLGHVNSNRLLLEALAREIN